MQHDFDFCAFGGESRLTVVSLGIRTSPEHDGTEVGASEIGRMEQVSSGGLIVEVGAFGGASFFVRTAYLREVSFADLAARVAADGRAECSPVERDDIVQAAFALAAERKALDLLARREQCRLALTQKLLAREFPRGAVGLALDYLESRGLLDDARFAEVWLRSHCSVKAQGRTRLVAELRSRGVSRDVAVGAVGARFAEVDESDECARAAEAAARRGRSGERLVKFLVDSGFPYAMAAAAARSVGPVSCGRKDSLDGA